MGAIKPGRLRGGERETINRARTFVPRPQPPIRPPHRRAVDPAFVVCWARWRRDGPPCCPAPWGSWLKFSGSAPARWPNPARAVTRSQRKQPSVTRRGRLRGCPKLCPRWPPIPTNPVRGGPRASWKPEMACAHTTSSTVWWGRPTTYRAVAASSSRCRFLSDTPPRRSIKSHKRRACSRAGSAVGVVIERLGEPLILESLVHFLLLSARIIGVTSWSVLVKTLSHPRIHQGNRRFGSVRQTAVPLDGEAYHF